jgi:hypothetical protein
MPHRPLAVLAPLALAAALLAPPAAAATDPDRRAAASIAGSWKGAVQSKDGPSGYSATVRLKKSGRGWTGRVTYHAVGTSTWRYQGRKQGWFVFRESFVSGRAQRAPKTAVQVKRAGARLKVRWLGSGSQVLGGMTARRL